ncbi:hypothetical protein BDA96_07G160500 [Sorghum bicolor]|jgi:hypothetical protein|uniref:Uncharacterized protein n=2 Tax=Sorghum bicolor TaxID=4558 RepID=A0A921UA32_SORBI|nr:hypothetical protein SORBI_3007G149400 [Sorghum bicolor]KAG0523873.1 hypothetical protein BDA96_07G160500 [Sorghum bicolor]
MDVPFFVAFSAILLVGKYLPSALPLNLRPALLADNAARPPARAAKCAISVAVSGLALLVSMQQQGSGGGGGGPAGVLMMMEARVLWFNSAALFLGTQLGVVAVALHPPAAPFVQQVAVDHLTVVTEIVAINAFAHNLCVFFKIFKV